MSKQNILRWKKFKLAYYEYNYLNTTSKDPGKLLKTGKAKFFEHWFDNLGIDERKTVFTKEIEKENTF